MWTHMGGEDYIIYLKQNTSKEEGTWKIYMYRRDAIVTLN
jgi:hypothetical protein